MAIDTRRAVRIHERLEANDEPTGTWIKFNGTGTWHHSTSFDGYEHGLSCGITVDSFPLDDLEWHPSEIPDDEPICQNCLGYTRSEERCRNCGRFCGVVYRWRGPSYSEVPSCTYCGINVPRCAHEDGTVSGCNLRSTHHGSHEPNRRDRYWCEEHAPSGADVLPYAERDEDV